MRPLPLIEALFVASFVTLAAVSLHEGEPPLPAIDVEALSAGPAREYWMGLFLEGRHVGYAVSREAETADGGRVFSQKSAFRMSAMGDVQDVVAVGAAVTDAQGRLARFDFMLSAPAVLYGRGEVREGAIHLEIVQGGEVQTITIPTTEPPALSQTLGAQIRGRTLVPGESFEVPYFDPVTMTNAPATVTVESPEVLPDGEAAWWLRTRFAGFETRRLVDVEGTTLREESPIGLSAVRMTKEEATAATGDPPDIVALTSVPIDGEPRGARVALRVGGVEMSRIPSEPPLQTVEGDVVTVSVPLLQELPSLPVRDGAHPDIAPTLTLPADNPEIVSRARAVVGDAPDRLEAARRLHEFVHGYVQKVPTIGVPNGLEVLRSGRGDCNEHTALYVSLARAVGIPARIAAGLVYSERMGDAFYYHAWPEVKLGGPTDWVPIDPTLGQFPADGTHLKIVTGDLDKQIEIMGLLGRVKLSLVR
ncbi:MAG: transglutaminase-like domain-containing protein [Myxococcota bacterium]